MKGILFDIGEGTVHDGPGLRITVFLKGCPLRCRWCHSPEGQRSEPEKLRFPVGERLAGTVWKSEELADYLNGMKALLRSGGVTFSGGEPLQQPGFLSAVLDRLNGLHTILETSGVGETEAFLRLAAKVDFVHFGLKILHPLRAGEWTGQSSLSALKNLRMLDECGETPYCFRMPLLARVTDTEENLRGLMRLSGTLRHLKRIDFLPSNPLAGAKYAACGRIFDPGFDVRAKGKVPSWFRPAVPWRILK